MRGATSKHTNFNTIPFFDKIQMCHGTPLDAALKAANLAATSLLFEKKRTMYLRNKICAAFAFALRTPFAVAVAPMLA